MTPASDVPQPIGGLLAVFQGGARNGGRLVLYCAGGSDGSEQSRPQGDNAAVCDLREYEPRADASGRGGGLRLREHAVRVRPQLLTQSSTSDRLQPGSLLRAAEVAGAAQALMQLSPARHRLSAAHPCSRVRPTRRPHFSAPALLRPSRRACLAAQARTNQPPRPPHLSRSVPAPSRTHRRSSANPASAMADPIARSRSSRAVSSTSSRRDANDRPSPIGAAKDKKDPPALDWSKFNFNFTVKHHPFPKDTARPAKRRKRSFTRKPELEENAFDKSLRTLYTVEPAKWWNGTKRYRKFTSEHTRAPAAGQR